MLWITSTRWKESSTTLLMNIEVLNYTWARGWLLCKNTFVAYVCGYKCNLHIVTCIFNIEITCVLLEFTKKYLYIGGFIVYVFNKRWHPPPHHHPMFVPFGYLWWGYLHIHWLKFVLWYMWNGYVITLGHWCMEEVNGPLLGGGSYLWEAEYAIHVLNNMNDYKNLDAWAFMICNLVSHLKIPHETWHFT